MDIWKPIEWDEELIDAINAVGGYGVSAEELAEALTLFSQSLLGPETCAEIVISNPKTDLEIFDQNGGKEEKVNFHLIEKIHII